ncbi:MAG: response regulator [Marivibrio sp.]|uniref:hybrid sensor histidine kinase/response regulator n=1 Tax=Marivibrio sp. TaxID=2039719 RepID=UPI0032F03E99
MSAFSETPEPRNSAARPDGDGPAETGAPPGLAVPREPLTRDRPIDRLMLPLSAVAGAGVAAGATLLAGGGALLPQVIGAALVAAAGVGLSAGVAGLRLKRATAARRRLAARLEALETAAEGRGLGVLVADGEGRARYGVGLEAFAPDAAAAAAPLGRRAGDAPMLVAQLIEPADDALPATVAAMAERVGAEEPQVRDFTSVDPRRGDRARVIELRLQPFGEGVVYLIEDVSERKAEADRALERLALLTRALDRAPFGILVIDEAGAVQEANSAFRRFLAGSAPIGRPVLELVAAADRPLLQAAIDRAAESGQPAAPVDVRLDGDAERTVAVYANQAVLPRGGGRGFVLHAVDATERKRLEAQFAQSQKMQAVGQLAGGIAHDFNNMLTAIIGFCDLMLQRHPVGEPSFADAMQIKQNANRAAGLVRQLLAFSRQQPLAPRVLDMTDLLAELSNLLRRLLGERVELTVVHERDLWVVRADPGQIEQVIINLAVNARDAMVEGGRLTIQTSNFTADRAYTIGDESMPPGDFVAVTVSDTGAGMSREVLDRVFEPFFTTKEVGMGTGLGLAMVYGSMRQLGGFVHAHSDGPGKGASFTLYLPRSDGQAVAASDEADVDGAPADTTGGGQILLVEDEDAVRLFAARALRAKGYEVTEARTGESALEILAARTPDSPPLDLLVTDMVMPKVDGATLIREARKQLPDLPVICISGYTQESVAQEVEALPQVYFLPKPFSLKQLAGKVKAAVESAAKSRA